MFWLLIACAKQPTPVDSGSTTPADSTVGGDSGGDGGGDSESETGKVPITIWEMAGPCGEWSGVQQSGTTWTYAASDSYVATHAMDGGFTTTATVIGEGEASTVLLTTTGKYKGEGSDFSYSRIDTWRCDAAGAWWVRNESTSSYTAGGVGSSISGWRTFTPGWLVRPATAEVGASWTDTFVLDAEVNGVQDEPTNVSCVSSVSIEETRAVEAGEFVARRVDIDCDTLSDTWRWLTRYLGVVETDDETLAQYLP